MPAVTRTIRGARRTGRGFGCAHPKCRCGFYPCADRRSASPSFMWRQRIWQWLGQARAQRMRREKERTCTFTLPCKGRVGERSEPGRGPSGSVECRSQLMRQCRGRDPYPIALCAIDLPLSGEGENESHAPSPAPLRGEDEVRSESRWMRCCGVQAPGKVVGVAGFEPATPSSRTNEWR